MREAFQRIAIAGWLVAGFCGPVYAQEAAAPPLAGFALAGPGLTSVAVTPESLATLPKVEREVSFQTSKGEQKGRFKGVLLWELMKTVGITRLPGHHAELQRTFLATGRDGYAIAFSVGEISPDFGNTEALIVDKVDGKPPAPEDGLRLIVPGDARGARNVRDVVSIEVR